MQVVEELTGEITKRVRIEQNLTQEGFGAALTVGIPGEEALSKQHIQGWEVGRQKPEYRFTVLVFLFYKDWRRDWAEEVLRVLKPNIWAIDPEHVREYKSGRAAVSRLVGCE